MDKPYATIRSINRFMNEDKVFQFYDRLYKYTLDDTLTVRKESRSGSSPLAKASNYTLAHHYFDKDTSSYTLYYSDDKSKEKCRIAIDEFFRIYPGMVDINNPENNPALDKFNPNFGTGRPAYTIEVYSEVKARKFEDNNTRVEAYMLFKSMTIDQKKSVAYWLLQNPADMDEAELTVYMADVVNGILMQGENLRRFIDAYQDVEQGLLQNEPLIIAQKAVKYSESGAKLVDVRDGKHYIGSTYMGKDFDDFVTTIQGDKQMYEALKKGVAAHEKVIAAEDKKKETVKAK